MTNDQTSYLPLSEDEAEELAALLFGPAEETSPVPQKSLGGWLPATGPVDNRVEPVIDLRVAEPGAEASVSPPLERASQPLILFTNVQSVSEPSCGGTGLSGDSSASTPVGANGAEPPTVLLRLNGSQSQAAAVNFVPAVPVDPAGERRRLLVRVGAVVAALAVAMVLVVVLISRRGESDPDFTSGEIEVLGTSITSSDPGAVGGAEAPLTQQPTGSAVDRGIGTVDKSIDSSTPTSSAESTTPTSSAVAPSPTTPRPTTTRPTTEASVPTTVETIPVVPSVSVEPPIWSVPTTQAPTTQAPTTQAPTTQAPTTQAPTTQAPTTQPVTTEAAGGESSEP